MTANFFVNLILQQLKNGEEICWSHIEDEVSFIGLNKQGNVVYEEIQGIDYSITKDFRMKPLCWVEGKPVYKGDTLYWVDGDDWVEIEVSSIAPYPIAKITWNKPKQKVKHKVWTNVYPHTTSTIFGCWYSSKASADLKASADRIACVETEIEYEV